MGLGLVAGIFGLTFGVAAADVGVSWPRATAFSFLVFGGSSQFATIAILGAGGTGLAAIATSAVLGARFAPMSIASAVRLRPRGWRRVAATVVLTDPSVLSILTEADEGRARRAYWLAGTVSLATWGVGTAVGSLVAEELTFDLAQLGLDIALPALLLAMLGAALRDAPSATHLGLGGLLTVAVAGLVPVGAEVLVGGTAATVLLAGLGRRP